MSDVSWDWIAVFTERGELDRFTDSWEFVSGSLNGKNVLTQWEKVEQIVGLQTQIWHCELLTLNIMESYIMKINFVVALKHAYKLTRSYITCFTKASQNDISKISFYILHERIQWWFRYWFEMYTICSIIIHSRSGDIKPFYEMHVQKKKKENHGNYNKIGKKYELRAWALRIVQWYLLSVSGSHSDFIFKHTICYIWNTELLRGAAYFGICRIWLSVQLFDAKHGFLCSQQCQKFS